MPDISNYSNTYDELIAICRDHNASLLAVSKMRTEKEILDLYKKGQRLFGENRAHELIIKASLLPTDIEWHLIGHLQTNKVQSVIRFATCIQSLDSLKLWNKLNEEAKEASTIISCMLQIKIAVEESKYGWDYDDLITTLKSGNTDQLKNVRITGVMGMASLTTNKEQIRNELQQLKKYYSGIKEKFFAHNDEFNTISMGMSGDYHIALEEGSNMIRIGSLLFSEKI